MRYNMQKKLSYALLLIASLTLVGVTPSRISANQHYSGEIGVDMQNFAFDKSLVDTVRDFSVTRSFSNHFLNFNGSGPIYNSNLANYALSTSLYGTYYQVSTDDNSTDTYIKPALNKYNLSVSLFPQRTYPLEVYVSKAKDYTLRYEANNRIQTNLLQPELAVVRRYQTEIKDRGMMWKYASNNNYNVTTEYKQSNTVVNRNYDFAEDRDIWIEYVNYRYNPIEAVHTIDIINSMLDDSAIIFIDLGLIDTLSPGGSISVQVDSGLHTIDVYPFKYNHYSNNNVTVHANMLWKILYINPATPNDLEQTTTVASSMVQYGDKEKLTGEAFFEYSDSDEKVQRMNIIQSTFSNNLTYDLSKNQKITGLTTWTRNKADITDISSQLNSSFMHRTSYYWLQRRGPSVSFSHSFSQIGTKTDVDDLTSTTNLFSNRITYPVNKWKYTADLKNTATLLSDNRGYSSDQYSTDLTNKMSFRFRRVKLEPKAQLKYSYNIRKNPDLKANEVETKIGLAGEIRELSYVGTLKFKSQYGWRRRGHEAGSNTIGRYLIDVSITRKFSQRLKVTAMSAFQRESYGGTSKDSTHDTSTINREDENRILYKIDVQSSPIDWASLGVAYGVISQKGATISRFSAMLNATIPRYKIPLKAILLSETRELEGLPKQVQTSVETKTSYRFRQITFTLSYSYRRESLLTEKFSLHEVLGKISRHFAL